MIEIDAMRMRIATATGLAGSLEIAQAAFALLLASCELAEDRVDEWFVAFAFAASAAAEGLSIISAAPSLPPSATWPGRPIPATADQAKIACLAGVLGAQLNAATLHARDPGDQTACRAAAIEAGRIHDLLAIHQ